MLYAFTIFVSAFLLFLVQPLIAKQILPWFGGTAAVWTVCLVFFQLLLLAGYIYADRLSRLAMRRQAIVHTVLAVAACLMLPIIPDAAWKPAGDADPTTRILLLLAATIGLPYLMVCTTGPLVQSWFARVHAGDARQARVWRLFALSNLASLVALVAYPFVLEPFASLRVQSWSWSAGFVLFAALVVASAWTTERRLRAARPATPATTPDTDTDIDATGAAAPNPPEDAPPAAPRTADYALWLGLAALGTVLLLSVTTHITQDVASVPFLWILPLALYLLTFILCFDSDRWYRRWLFWPGVMLLAPAMIYGLRAGNGVLPVDRALPLFCGGLFVICMFCHGELVRARPAPAWLTRFYLMISLGGALGGLFVGLLAPRIFSGAWELPLAILASTLLLWRVARGFVRTPAVLLAAALFVALAWFMRERLTLPLVSVLALLGALAAVLAVAIAWLRHSFRASAALVAGLSAACCVWLGWVYWDFTVRNTALIERNFYGVLRVNEYGKPGEYAHAKVLLHGVISHGQQYMADDVRRLPTSYYGETSGAGLAIGRAGTRPQRIGVIGLGAGSLAAYGQPGGTVRFYEINPAVADIARDQFTFLRESRAATEVVLGDARLSLERELEQGQPQQFDVLVIDAFSSDSIPVHLMTREAMALYARHIKPDGVIAFHVSNRFLKLPPVVALLAQDAGLAAVLISDPPHADKFWLNETDYVLVARPETLQASATIQQHARPIEPLPGLRVWTDDYNNLFRIMK